MHIRHGAYCGRAPGPLEKPPPERYYLHSYQRNKTCASSLLEHYSASILALFTTLAQLARSVLTFSPSCAGLW